MSPAILLVNKQSVTQAHHERSGCPYVAQALVTAFERYMLDDVRFVASCSPLVVKAKACQKLQLAAASPTAGLHCAQLPTTRTRQNCMQSGI